MHAESVLGRIISALSRGDGAHATKAGGPATSRGPTAPDALFFVLTIAGDAPAGWITTSFCGTWSPSAGATREEVFLELTGHHFIKWRKITGAARNPTVIYWSLDTNELPRSGTGTGEAV